MAETARSIHHDGPGPALRSASSSGAGRFGRLGLRLQLWLSPGARGRLKASVRRAELDGVAFAFRARAAATVVVAAWLLISVSWPRDAYYLSLAVAFFLLGYAPYRLRRHRNAEIIKLVFVVLDVMLVTGAILIPPPAGLGVDWPVQTRFRGPEFLYLLLLLGEASLTYSPLRVIWTGGMIATAWSVGFQMLYERPDTLRFADVAPGGTLTPLQALRLVFDPTYVGVTQWQTQLVATALLTAMLATAVWRSRRALLAHVESEVVRSDLARYVSPDVADALAAKALVGFGEPSTRTVAVLFADIVGFTAMTERMPADRTFALLRSFQERCCRIVFEHGGTLDKYLGDGFMATFGGLEEQPDASARALACAFDLQAEMTRWSAKRSGRGAQPVALAIGVHCGAVTVGNLGADRRIEFTVVGDVVNLASRLEQATRDIGACIATSQDCLEAAGPDWPRRFHRAVEMQLRGRESATRIHLVHREGAAA